MGTPGKSLIKYMIYKNLFHYVSCLFILLIISFEEWKFNIFVMSDLSGFLMLLYCWHQIEETIAWARVIEIYVYVFA